MTFNNINVCSSARTRGMGQGLTLGTRTGYQTTCEIYLMFFSRLTTRLS